MLKKLIIGAIIVIILVIIGLNSGIVADQAVSWVQAHPKDPSAPDVLYRTGRWCDIMGNDKRAAVIYLQLYQQYPERGDLCAPALYYTAADKVNNTYIVGIKKESLQYLDILFNQYSSEKEWCTKGKQLYDEVNYVH